MKEGGRATLHSAGGFPKRHPFAIAGFCISLALLLLGVGVYETHQEVTVQHNEITKIVKSAAACNLASLKNEKRSEHCAARIRIGIINCRRDPACKAALEGLPVPPAPSEKTSPTSTAEGGGAFHSGSSPGHQTGGGAPPNKPPKHEPKGNGNGPKTEHPSGGAPPATPPPPTEEGNQGGNGQGNGQGNEGAGAGTSGTEPEKGVGVEVCVNNPLLPACVKAGLSAGE